MSREDEVTIRTRVAHSGYEDARYCGWSLFGELAGRESLAGYFTLGIANRVLSFEERALLDDIVAVYNVADPRIWPLKAVRLLASCGSVPHGLAAGLLVQHTPLLGGAAVSFTAGYLEELMREVGQPTGDLSGIAPRLFEKTKQRDLIPGFGVVLRKKDERVAALKRCVRMRARDALPYWKLSQVLEDAVRATRHVEPNITLGLSAVWLDLGFSPRAISSLGLALCFPSLMANAVEEAQQKNACLRRLPDDRVCYSGRGPRESTRAIAARASMPQKE